jgi:hypothetical protein
VNRWVHHHTTKKVLDILYDDLHRLRGLVVPHRFYHSKMSGSLFFSPEIEKACGLAQLK